MYVQRNNNTRSCNHCCNGKAISITYSECVFVVTIIQHAKRRRCVAICGLCTCPHVHLYRVFTHLVKGHDYKEKCLLNLKCVL